MRSMPWLFVLVMMAASNSAPSEAELTAAIRELLEASLREQAGIGFASFGCDVTPPLGPGDRFVCEGIDDAGDHLRYTLAVDEQGGATVVRAEQPAGSLSTENLQLLEAPCRAFLDDFQRAGWHDLYGQLHPSLQAEVGGPDAVRSMLEPVLAFFGEVEAAGPTWFAVLPSGANELEYRLRCRGGEAQGRFRIASDEAGALRLTAFAVTAFPGSPEQARWLEQIARDRLAQVIGLDIAAVDAPLVRLVRQGDVVEGTARLEDGRVLAVGVTQHGVRDDYDVDDFRFAVLDVPFLIERALRPRLAGYRSLQCGARVIPDGGETTCTATLTGGGTREYRVRRRGGDHRMAPVDGEHANE